MVAVGVGVCAWRPLVLNPVYIPPFPKHHQLVVAQMQAVCRFFFLQLRINDVRMRSIRSSPPCLGIFAGRPPLIRLSALTA